MWRRSFRALTTVVEIQSECDVATEMLDALTCTYEPCDAPRDVFYRVSADGDKRCTERDGEVLHETTLAIDVAPVIEIDLYRQVVGRTRNAVVLHAGAVIRGGAATVMVGPSGAGKTTLTRALIDDGGAYLSDESVAIFEDREVAGLARPMLIRDTPPPAGPYERRTYRWREHGETMRESTLLAPAISHQAHGRWPLSSLTLIEYRPGKPGAIETLGGGEALARLWPCVQNPHTGSLKRATALVSAVPIRSLHSPSIPAALALLAGLQGP